MSAKAEPMAWSSAAVSMSAPSRPLEIRDWYVVTSLGA